MHLILNATVHAPELLEKLNKELGQDFEIHIEGELCPSCRRTYDELLRKYEGDWTRVIDHIVVRRFLARNNQAPFERGQYVRDRRRHESAPAITER